MPDQVWTKTTSGNVFGDDGVTVVGTGDGAGTITINAGALVWMGNNDTATLTVREGVTIRMGAGARFRCRGLTSTYQGTMRFEGTASEPILITSDAGTPAPGDHFGIEVLGSATDPLFRPEVYLDYVTIEYATACVNDIQGGTDYESKVDANYCIFRHFSSVGISRGGEGGYADGNGNPDEASGPWTFDWCQFYQQPGDFNSTNQQFVVTNGHSGSSTATRATIWLTHCSFLANSNDAFEHPFLDIRTFAQIIPQDCCFRGFNSGAGNINYVYFAGSGIALPNATAVNFISVDAMDHPGSSITFGAGPNEQLVDPGYEDETTPLPFDLTPNGSAGDPDLAYAASDGIWVGAIMPDPSTYPPGGLIPDPEGTGGVWAGRKQIVKRCSLGDDLNRRGRAIRIGLRSTDLKGAKLIGAVFLIASAEELK